MPVRCLLAALMTLACGLLHAQAPAAPRMPFTNKGVCPFECCHLGRWTALEPSTAFSSRNSQGRVAFSIRTGDVVTAIEGWMITARPGLVRMKTAHRFYGFSVPAGATLYVLSIGGEGESPVWYRGAVHTAEVYADSVRNTNFLWDVLSVPDSTWWVRVRDARRATGWLRQPQNQFDGMDDCRG